MREYSRVQCEPRGFPQLTHILSNMRRFSNGAEDNISPSDLGYLLRAIWGYLPASRSRIQWCHLRRARNLITCSFWANKTIGRQIIIRPERRKMSLKADYNRRLKRIQYPKRIKITSMTSKVGIKRKCINIPALAGAKTQSLSACWRRTEKRCLYFGNNSFL